MRNVFIVRSMRTNKIYILLILNIKNTNQYKILNLRSMKLSKCTFSSVYSAIKDIFTYQYDKRNVVITSGLLYNIVKLLTIFSKRFILNEHKEIWF